MNFVWLKSPFRKFDSSNIKYNETLRSEARFLQKLSKINEFHVENLKLSANERQQKSSKGNSKLSPENTVRITVSSNENLPPRKSLRNKARDIHLTVKSRSVSCLRGKNLSASTAVLKIHSKTNLKKKDLRSSKHPDTKINSEKDRLSTPTGGYLNGNDNVLEENGESDAIIPIKRTKRISSSNNKKKNQSSSNTSRSAEDGTIGDSLFYCPFELVEIYSVQKERPLDFGRQLSNINRKKDCIKTFPKEGGESSESAILEECICAFPGIRSSKIKEEIRVIDADTKSIQQSDYKVSAATLLNNETSVEPTRDRRDPNSMKVKVDLTKTNQTTQLYDLSGVGNTFEPSIEQYEAHKKFNFTSTSEENWKSNLRKKQEKTDEKIYLKRSEEPKGCLKCYAKEVHPSSTIRNNPPVSRFGKSRTKSDEALLSTCKKSVNDVASVKMFVENEDLVATEKKDEKVMSQGADSSNKNNLLTRESIGSSERGISKSLDSKRSGTSSSESDSPLLEDTVINLQEKKPFSGTKNSDNESLRKKKTRVIIAKRRNEKNNANVEATTDNVSGSSDEDTRMPKIDDTEEGQYRISEKKMTKFEIQDPKSGITKCETERTMFNYEDIKICKVLMKIHAHLSCDWQKRECIRMKLRDAVPIDTTGSVITLQLLDKTIARCKSYIHGSNDSFKTESESTKLLSKYVVQLVTAVNKNKLAAEEQERHITRAQSKSSEEQDLNKKKKTLDELALSSNVWTQEISCLIETISSLIKNIMADNEKKENVNTPRKHKLMNRRITNMLPTNETKQRKGVVRSKIMKANLAKKGNHIKTQIFNPLNLINSVKQSKSKTSFKVEYILRSREKEKLLDIAQSNLVEKKINDITRHPEKGRIAKKLTQLNANANQPKQSISRQRYRTASNVQPVWRPGGAVKIPSSSNATMLTQKPRPLMHAKEITNQPIENSMTCSNKRGNSLDHNTTKRNLCNVEKNVDDNRNRAARICNFFPEPKQERTTVECKKKVFMETYSVKDILPTREVDNSKVCSKRSNTSVKTSPRVGPRSGTVRGTSKSCNDHLQHGSESASSKHCEKTSYEKTARQKTSKESKILRVLEDIIKTTPMEKKGDKSTRNLVDFHEFQYKANSVHFELRTGSTLDKEDVKINEEEPTRDIDTSEFVKDRPKVSEMVHENPQSIEELPQRPLALLLKDFPPFPITNLSEDVVDVEGSTNLEISQPNAHSSSVIVANAGCVVDLNSSSDSIANIEHTKCCQTSLNFISSLSTSHQEQNNEKYGKCDDWLACSDDCNPDRQKSKKPSDIREERTKVNSHAMSLSILKEFLCDQGVHVDLVDRAERCLKEKQKTVKCLKKKRVNPIDVPPSAQNLQNECYCEVKLKGNIENHEKDFVECKENRKGTDNTSNCPSLQPPPERKDAATCKINYSSDASSQTDLQWKFTKSLQTIFERDILTPVQQKTTETQTEMVLPKEINNLTNKNRDASVITESLLISDSFMETVQVSYASKSVETDHVDRIQNGSTKNMQEYVPENGDNSPEMSIYICNEEGSGKYINNDDQYATKSYHHASKKLSSQMYECYDGSLTTSKRNDEVYELCLVKSNAATSFSSPDVSSVCSKNCVRNETVTHEESHKLSAKVISNEMLAALQVAVIRACNVYRAFDFYKRNLKRKLKKIEKQKKRQRTARKNTEMRKRTIKNVSKRNSVSGITTKHWELFNENGVAEVLKVLKCMEVATVSNKESLVFHNESEHEISKSVSMPSTSTPCSGNIFEAIEPKISKKSFSNITLKDVKSVMEFLVRETENVKLEHTRCVKKIWNPTYPKFGNRKMKSGKIQKQGEFSIIARETLLPLVYGVVCCIVFWCLQFTFTCDIIL